MWILRNCFNTTSLENYSESYESGEYSLAHPMREKGRQWEAKVEGRGCFKNVAASIPKKNERELIGYEPTYLAGSNFPF